MGKMNYVITTITSDKEIKKLNSTEDSVENPQNRSNIIVEEKGP